MIIGAHVIIQSRNPGADRAFIEKLTFPSVSMGDGFTIYGLPPSEVAIHESDKNDVHEFYLMCDNAAATVREFEAAGLACTPVANRGWGLLTTVTLPGGGKLGVYEPTHPRPKQHAPSKSKAKKTAKPKHKAAKKAAKKTTKKKAKARRR
jgi:hypothetical protein